MALVTVSGAGAEPREAPLRARPARTAAAGPTGGLLSPAAQRAKRDWPAADDRDIEFFTNFKYSRISGIGKEPVVSRRDPSKVVRVGDKYYVWYATSEDGFAWDEQGAAVPRALKGQYGDRSLTTTDILAFQGKY